MEIFSERLKRLRQESGISQRAFAKILGIAHASYQRYERENGEPNQTTLVKIAQHFDVSTDYLLGLTNDE